MNAEHFAMTASLSVQSARKKPGSAADRAALAQFARDQRARFGTLLGGWSYSAWNHQISVAIQNNLSRMTRARRLTAVKGAK
jgi:acyl-coenzyme A thioesterase PaaI-like protein